MLFHTSIRKPCNLSAVYMNRVIAMPDVWSIEQKILTNQHKNESTKNVEEK